MANDIRAMTPDEERIMERALSKSIVLLDESAELRQRIAALEAELAEWKRGHGELCSNLADCVNERDQLRHELEKAIEDAFPTSWLDPLLTGKDAVIGDGPLYHCQDIERLLAAIKSRITRARG